MSESKFESKSESKSESKDSNSTSLIDRVQGFCMSAQLETQFEDFTQEFSSVFACIDSVIEGDEHPLQYYDVYKEYLNRFERKIENFIIQEGYTVETFFKECRYILENDEVYGSQRFFVETLLATSEYQYFFILMRAEMHSINQSKAKK